MDPVSLGVTVVGLIVKAITSFGKAASAGAAEEAGKAAGEVGKGVLKRILDRVRARFTDSGDTKGADALERLEADPTSAGWREEVDKAIRRHLEADASFASEMAGLVSEARQSGFVAGGDLIVQNVTGTGNNVVGKAEGGAITNIGR